MRILLTTTACMLLAACGPEEGGSADADGDGTITNEEVAAAAAGMEKPRAGRWEVEAEVLEISMPGMPAGMEGMMNNMFADMFGNYAYCLTPEEAEGDPEALWKETNGDCEWEQFDMSGGRAESVAVCKGPEGGNARMQMSGTYSDTAYSATNTMTMDMPQGEGMVKVKVDGRHAGACTGDEMDNS